MRLVACGKAKKGDTLNEVELVHTPFRSVPLGNAEINKRMINQSVK